MFDRKKYMKEYNEKYRDRIKAHKAAYYLDNKEYIDSRNKEYDLNNAEEKKKRTHKSYLRTKDKRLRVRRERYKNEIEFRLREVLRARVRDALKGRVKRSSVIEVMGCDIAAFRKHLESNFDDKMNWDNYGQNGWHIDHIKPLNDFDLQIQDEYERAFHYSNMQPLWCHENWRKGAK